MKFVEAVKKIEAIQKKYQKSLNVYADEIRRELVIPICKQYKLTYRSGNGLMLFVPTKDCKCLSPLTSSDDAKESGYLDIAAVFDVLDIVIDDNDCIGYHVEGVTPEDLRAR